MFGFFSFVQQIGGHLAQLLGVQVLDVLEDVAMGLALTLLITVIVAAIFMVGLLANTIRKWLQAARLKADQWVISVDRRLAQYGNTLLFQFAHAQLEDFLSKVDDPDDPLVVKAKTAMERILRFQALSAEELSTILAGGVTTLRDLFDGVPKELPVEAEKKPAG